MAAHRPAVRIVCLDSAHRVLLLRWYDPADGSHLWEPPGGGVEPGESPLDAARRELVEETGLDPAAIDGPPVTVERDSWWNGEHKVGPEQFFLARFAGERPAPVGTGLLADEVANLRSYAWVPWSELGRLPDRLEPPGLVAVLAELVPEGPWR